MKIFNVEQIRECDAYTIKNEPIASIDLMERAANGLFVFIQDNFDRSTLFHIFCGPGNNGGDGFALARIMADNQYNVLVYATEFSDTRSEDCSSNYNRLIAKYVDKVISINDVNNLPIIQSNDIIIDAILGTGLSKKVEGNYASLIKYLNMQEALKIAVDIPSGLWADNNKNNDYTSVFKADITLTFQFPKMSFFFVEHEDFVGDWFVIDINLSKEYIQNTSTKYEYIINLKDILGKRYKFAHKGNYGHGLLISGSFGKMGATILAAKAALRTGIGLLTVYAPKVGYNALQTAVPEAMLKTSENENIVIGNVDYSNYSAIAIGPGLGTHKDTAGMLKLLIQNYKSPIIFDADALNILSENKTWLSFIPKNSILTPHLKEFIRLFGDSRNSYERLALQKEMSEKYNIFIVLKGHFSSITTPSGNIFFNSTGNPGMATGGTGDVLTGIILGMLSQSADNILRALIGAVYIHGLAGDVAASKYTQQGMISSDIIECLPEALRKTEY